MRLRTMPLAALGLSVLAGGACTPGPAAGPTGPVAGPTAPVATVSPAASEGAAAPPDTEALAATPEKTEDRYARCLPGPETTSLRGSVAFPDDTTPGSFSISLGRQRAGWHSLEDCDNRYVELPAPGTAAGTFAFDGLPPGVYEMSVLGAGFVDHSVDPFELTAGEPGDAGKLVLDRGRKLVGRVLGTDGAPAAGVEVHTSDDRLFGDGRRFFALGLAPTATTGPDGRFTITALGREAVVAVADDPTTGRSAAVQLAAGNGDLMAELRLVRTGSLGGTVTHDGKPVSADVTARPAGLGRAVILTAMTGEDGHYHFDRLAEGDYVITAQMNIGDVQSLAFPAKAAPVKIGAGTDGRLDLAIPEGIRLVIKPKLTRGQADVVSATLVKGTFSAATDADIERAMDRLDLERARQHHAHLSEATPIELLDVPPGSYTLCGVATAYMDTRAEIARRAATCSPVRVNAGREHQDVTLAVAGR